MEVNISEEAFSHVEQNAKRGNRHITVNLVVQNTFQQKVVVQIFDPIDILGMHLTGVNFLYLNNGRILQNMLSFAFNGIKDDDFIFVFNDKNTLPTFPRASFQCRNSNASGWKNNCNLQDHQSFADQLKCYYSNNTCGYCNDSFQKYSTMVLNTNSKDDEFDECCLKRRFEDINNSINRESNEASRLKDLRFSLIERSRKFTNMCQKRILVEIYSNNNHKNDHCFIEETVIPGPNSKIGNEPLPCSFNLSNATATAAVAVADDIDMKIENKNIEIKNIEIDGRSITQKSTTEPILFEPATPARV